MASSSVVGLENRADDPDFDLVSLAKKELPNRTQAYEALMRRHEKLLYRVCFRIMGNADDAEDVFQDVMVKVYNGILKFEYRSSFKTWLFKIAHNVCYSSISRMVKSREYKKMLADNIVEEPSVGTTDANIDAERILSMLPPEDRELITLKYVCDLKFEEIAQVCDMGVSAVKMRIYRAVDQIKKKHELHAR